MKKTLFLLLLVVAGFSSCKKDDDYDSNAQAAADDASIQAYLKTNNITTATKDPSGLYYQILTPGSGPYPTGSSTVVVNYSGMFLNGTVFDSGNNFLASLSPSATSSVITGWQIGLQHVNVGGKIKLFVPSTLAYGNNDNGKIPKNSVLIFTIELVSIQ